MHCLLYGEQVVLIECCTLTTGSEVRKNVKWLRGEMLTSPENRGLKIFGNDNAWMPNTGPSCLPSTVKVLRTVGSGVTCLQTIRTDAG